MKYTTMRSYCEQNEHSAGNAVFTNATKVDFLDMLCRTYGMDITMHATEWSTTDEPDQLTEILCKENLSYIRELCKQLADLGYLEPVLRFGLMLKRWDDQSGRDTFGGFLEQVAGIRVLGQDLTELCIDGINTYIDRRAEENDSFYPNECDNFGREFDLLSQYVAKKVLGVDDYSRETVLAVLKEKGVYIADPLVRSGWLSHFCHSWTPAQQAEVLCQDFLPGMTSRCKKEKLPVGEDSICIRMARLYLDTCVNFGSFYLNVPLTEEERSLVQEGTLLSDWEKDNSFLRDIQTEGHVTRFVPLYPGLGQACKNFLEYQNTALFQALCYEIPTEIQILVPVMVYSLYAENQIPEASRAVLEFLSQTSESIYTSAGMQRIAVRCCMEQEDVLQMLALYKYVEMLYAKCVNHTNIHRRFPTEGMYLVTKHRDRKLLEQAHKFVQGSNEIRNIGKAKGMTEEEILAEIQSDKFYQEFCHCAKESLPSRADVELQVLQSRDDFFTHAGIPVEDLMNRLTSDDARKVMDCLVEGDAVFQYLEKLGHKGFLVDYSPAILEITKALEIVFNVIFSKLPTNLNTQGLSSRQISSNLNNGLRKDHITMGEFAYLLSSNSSDVDLFSHWNLGRYVNDAKLQNLANLSITKKEFNSNATVTGSFRNCGRDVDSKNRRLLREGILYVGGEFRNKVAHTGITEQTDYVAAKELILSTQYLLWIMLYIMRP